MSRSHFCDRCGSRIKGAPRFTGYEILCGLCADDDAQVKKPARLPDHETIPHHPKDEGTAD